MRFKICLALAMCTFAGVLFVAGSYTEAQAQPGGKKGDKKAVAESEADLINRMMAFNKSKDGKLTKEEVTDPRLHALFDRADINKDGVVTREELAALFARESLPAGGFGPGDDGPKGKGPKGGSPPQPGRVLPQFLQDALNLSDNQRKQIAELQKEVDARLDTILTDEQKTQLRAMGEKGPKGTRPGEKKGPPPDGK